MAILLDTAHGDRDQSNRAPVARAVQPVEQSIGARLRQQRGEPTVVLSRFLSVIFHSGQSATTPAGLSFKNDGETLGEGGAR